MKIWRMILTQNKNQLSCRHQCEVECAEEVMYTVERMVENTEHVTMPTFTNMITYAPVQPMFSGEISQVTT
jgi:hypothetical protein